MHRIANSLITAGLFASALTAQAGPGMTDADPTATGHQAMVKSTYFSSVDNAATTLYDVTPKIWTVAGKNITQVSIGKTGIAGLAAGEYHMCMTTDSLSSTFGPAGAGDVIMGKVTWNSGSPVFTPNTMANLMNSAGNDFGLMIDGKNGNFAAIDYPTGPYLSERLTNVLPFPAPVAITGAGGTYVDPAPGHIDGVLGLFWVSGGTTISWAPLTLSHSGTNLTAASLNTARTIIVITAANQPHSPTPVFGANGDSHGMWFSRVTGSDSDQYFTGTLPDNSGGQLVYDSTAWSNNAGMAGDHFVAAYSGHYNTLLEGQGHYAICNSPVTVSATATLDIRMHGLTGVSPNLYTSILGISTGVGPKVPLPGILGEFGLNGAGLAFILGGPTGMGAEGIADVSFPAKDTSLKGLTIHIQAVHSPIAGAGPAFTNTISPSFQ